MIEVKVIVEIPGLPEALNALAGAMQGASRRCGNEGPGTQAPVAFVNTAPPQQIPVPDNGVIANPSTAAASSVAAPTPAAMPNAPVAAAAPSPVAEAPSAPAPAPAPTAYTMDDLGRAGATLIDAGKMPQLIALLGKFGVQAVTQLKAEQFAAFADELKALGAKF